MSSLLTKLKNRFPQGSFIRNVSVLAGGTALGQAIVILASPILTRLYTPEDFGLLAVYASLLGVAAVVATLRYELAIPLPKEDTDAANVLALSLGAVLLMTLLGGALIWLLDDEIILWVNAPDLRPYLWLLPLGILALGSYQAFNYWAVRRKAFARIARTKVNQGLGSVITQLGLGLISTGPAGLLLGQVVGQASGTTTLAALAIRGDRSLLSSISLPKLKAMAIRYRRFPLISTWPSVLNTLSLQLPSLLLVTFYSTSTAGWFILAQRVLSAPTQLISQSVTQVFFGRAAELVNTDPTALKQLFYKVGRQLALISIGPLIILVVVAPRLFSLVFGPEWVQAGTFVQFLSPMIFAQFVISPIASLNALERQDLFLYWNIARILLSVGALYTAYSIKLSAVAALGFYSLGMLVAYLLLAGLWLHAINQLINDRGRNDNT